MLLLTLNWFFSLIFMFLNHPLSLGSILLIQTIIISLASGFLYYNFWFSYVLFLVMVGGMLVMFMYMTSIASNEKFKLSNKSMLFMILLSILILLVSLHDKFFSIYFTYIYMNMNQMMMFINYSMSKFYNPPNSLITFFLIIYLLVTLIAIVKIIGKSSKTLRQK
uniref:NADH-ubiquinone oxidoreductase chain 6 n=1 Tax=Curculionidae sp. KM-2017 TaxID=2219391 RepID=A0A346RFR2_9CUCU|nr:NADH dehydrogenase subunit 6 [Curculionidae sp. KM-2017]